MKQPQWDKYEAAFLLEYCLKVENNELSRKEAITTVSEHLRERAKDRGFEIDEVFRNENGISMQMSAMRNCYLEKNKGLTISKLFKEVVALYKTNRNIFEKIIQEESSKVNKTIYQEFLLWLKTEKPNDTKEVIEYLSMLSMFVIKRKQLHKPIADITDADEIEHLQSIMNKPETLGIHSKKMSAKIDKALKMYLHFLHSKDKKDLSCLNCKSVLIEEKQSEDYFKVDFSSSQNYAHTKPVSCRYKGRNIPCSGWNSVFINITRAIYQDCHTKFPVGHSLSSSSRIDIGSPEGMVYPKEIANGIYLECNVSASGVVSKLRALMVICGMNYSDVVIEYRQNVKQSKVQKKTETAVIPSTQLQWMPHFTKELTELIAKSFIIASDHGASRLAVLHHQEEKYETDTKGEHSGRCCKEFPDADLPNAIRENGYFVLSDYGRFKNSRAANVEVHGGATLEEVVVPVIRLSLRKQDDVVIKLLNADAIYCERHSGTLIEFYISDVENKNNIALVIAGKRYVAVPFDSTHYSVTLNDIKRAKKNIVAEIYDGDNLIGSVKFDIKGKDKGGEI